MFLAISMTSALVVVSGAGSLTWWLVAGKSVEQRIKGTWSMRTYNRNGQEYPNAESYHAGIKLGDNGAFVLGVTPGTYRLDTRTKPMQMEQTIKGSKWTVIFQLQEDTLTVCYPAAPEENLPVPSALPTDFEPGKGKLLISYSRVRP
jgi:uncharacterized protein (TIGR03067 family)